jgi:DNA recombination protein RmuC
MYANIFIYLLFLVALCIGVALGWLIGRMRLQNSFGEERAQLISSRDVLKVQLGMLANQRDEDRKQQEQQLVELRQQHKEQLEQQMTLIREQMNSASEKILRERQEQLAATNEQQLAAILNPLRENIKQMREAVEKSDREQTTTMERLDASIKENLRQAQQVGERADMLAQALTSENKTQGNFGELRLRQLLEQMGLERGVQYEEQVTLRNAEGQTATDEEGHRLIPDVILHFPDERDVIIDSKVSLTAFEDYFHASSDEEKAAALRRHVSSMRSHVYELSRKNYSQYIREGRHRLDFVLMYVFSESALQLALGADAKLWRDAYDKGVIIAGSQSLFIMLRVLEMSWKQMRQFENQQDIMRQANLLIDRVQLFYERFLKVDEQLHRTQEAFDELRRSTAPNGLSITTAATRLLKYGAQENPKRRRHLPKAEDDVEEEDLQE